METIILSEADCLNDRLASYDSTPFDPRNDISLAVANAIHTLVHGYRLEYDDPKLPIIVDMASKITSQPFISNNMLKYLPFLYYLPQKYSRLKGKSSPESP